MIRFRTALILTAALSSAASAFAQPSTAKPADATAKPAYTKVCPDCEDRRRDPESGSTRTFYLKYVTSQHDINDLATALRVLMPEDKIIVVTGESAIVIHAISEDMTLAEKIINDLDRPKKTWRLTYTVTEMDGANRIGAQHYSMVVADGQETMLKQGDRIPIVTGRSTQTNDHLTEVSYQDIGMTFTALLNELDKGAHLRSDVEQTGLADDKSNVTDPVFRQVRLKGEATLLPGKPFVLGTLDMPGSTHHLQVEVLMEPLL